MKALKIKLSDRVVLYNQGSNVQACRVYWMFKTYGHPNVSILNGGFKKWAEEKRPVESHADDANEDDYAYTFNGDLHRSIE